MKRTTETTLEARRVLEYRYFFAGERPIDVRSTLKRFNRNELVRMAAILSLHYGNMCFPDNKNTLFSESSKKYIPYLNKLFEDFYNRERISWGQKVEVVTYRTGLELWRQIYAIHVDEFKNEVEESDAELLLFKVVLTLNEKITGFSEAKEPYKLDELIFLNNYLTNDSNNYVLKAVLQPQLYYFYQLINFIPSNEVMQKATDVLFKNWGIVSWQQYYTTLFIIAHETDGYIQRKENGVPIITPAFIDQNKRFISQSLLERLCIDEDEYIPYEGEDEEKREWNIDYRRFRSKPFVKLKDGSGYIVINNQLVCERLYNSLFFDYNPLINGRKDSCGFFDYNKGFVEKVLFRNAFFNCLSTNCFTFPAREQDEPEDAHEPDFYVRTKNGELVIVECKAVKMNGECRDDGDYHRLLDELHEKIVRKTRNIDSTRKEFKRNSEPIGVGQLINHIDSIEEDTFKWDTNIPDDVSYYPLLVFEDIKLVQKGILSIVNRWFNEDVKNEWDKLELSEISYKPIMVVSIYTLYLYDSLLQRKGLTAMIDSFVEKYAKYDSKTGEYTISELADFDEYLRLNSFNKRNDMMKWHKKLMAGNGN